MKFLIWFLLCEIVVFLQEWALPTKAENKKQWLIGITVLNAIVWFAIYLFNT